MRYNNAYIFQGEEGFVRGGLRVEDGRIAEVIREDAASQRNIGSQAAAELPAPEEEED